MDVTSDDYIDELTKMGNVGALLGTRKKGVVVKTLYCGANISCPIRQVNTVSQSWINNHNDESRGIVEGTAGAIVSRAIE